MATQAPTSFQAAVQKLAFYFGRNGYLRWQNVERLKREGYNSYKKGDEIRLVALTRNELRTIRHLLSVAGFKPARAFAKGKHFRQPIYGRRNVARFLCMLPQRPDN